MILFALPYLRIRQYQYESFRFLFFVFCAFVYGTVQYRNGNLWLSDCYGCCWSLVCKDTDKSCHTDIESVIAYILYILLTSLSTTDLFPRFIRAEYVKPYALKALPCTLIWLKIVWEQLTQDFARPSD